MYATYSVIKNCFFDENKNEICIDGYKTSDENEEGVVLARINVKQNFSVEWYVDEAKNNPFVLKAICEAIDKYREEHRKYEQIYSACINFSFRTKAMFHTKQEAYDYSEEFYKKVCTSFSDEDISSYDCGDVQFFNHRKKEWEYTL